MSSPASRLSYFRSFSYYHILAVCDSSETAAGLGFEQDLEMWDHATTSTAVSNPNVNSPLLGKFSPKQMGNGKYVILVNGSSDAQFVITDARWSCSTAANAVPGDKSTSIATEGKLVISEPQGIVFLDSVVKACVSLGVDSAQAVFVLKTIFVGYRHENGEDVMEVITDIPPLNFIAYDVTGSFTEAGGVYSIDFVAVANGATRLPQYSKAVQSIALTAGDSLEETLTKLQDSVNENYDRYFKCVVAQMESAGATPDMIAALRPVKYQIKVGDAYLKEGQVSYTVSNQPQQYKNNHACAAPAQVAFPTNTSIESAISNIMLMSPQVLSDMNAGDKEDAIRYEFKVQTALDSKISEDGKIDYTVAYKVDRFMVPASATFDVDMFEVLSQDESEIANDPNADAIRANTITFDYIYTGKNIDILEFDMSVNMGLAYLQTATQSNTFKDQTEPVANRQTQISSADANSAMVRAGESIVQVPVFFGSQITSPQLANQQNASDGIQSAYTLTKHSSVEAAEASMRIVGNDQLMISTNRSSSAESVVGTEPSTDELGAFGAWAKVPAYARVNVKMPRKNDNYDLYTGGDKNEDFAQDFWFDGYYYVHGIEHIFEKGEFTQKLEMIGIPKKSAFSASASQSQADTQLKRVNNNVSACYDSNIGCGASVTAATPAAPEMANTALPEVPPSGSTEPTNSADAAVVNNSAQDPSVVRGWDNAAPAVKSAIINAANKFGLSPVTMAQMAHIESSFNPNAYPARGESSATGLYQFIGGTWNGLVKQGKIPGLTTANGLVTVDPNNKKPKPGDIRFNPQLNAYAGAAFLSDNAKAIGSYDVGDLYLAHFMGPATAKKIIANVKSSGGSTKLSEVLGQSNFDAVRKANPSIVNVNTTTGQIRTWAATKMAKSLKSGAQPQVAKATPVVEKRSNDPTTNAPTNPPAQPRQAKETVASVQSCDVREEKKPEEITTCGPRATDVDQDPQKSQPASNASN